MNALHSPRSSPVLAVVAAFLSLNARSVFSNLLKVAWLPLQEFPSRPYLVSLLFFSQKPVAIFIGIGWNGQDLLV